MNVTTSSMVYGSGMVGIQRRISGSRQARATASASSSWNGRSVTSPSCSGGWGGWTGRASVIDASSAPAHRGAGGRVPATRPADLRGQGATEGPADVPSGIEHRGKLDPVLDAQALQQVDNILPAH